jgi:hypothetical protein
MQLTRLFGDMSYTYAHLFSTALGEVDMNDVVLKSPNTGDIATSPRAGARFPENARQDYRRADQANDGGLTGK